MLNAEGQVVENAQVELRFQGTTVARTATTQDGRFEIGGVRGGAHDLTVGSVATPVRLWKTGTAPQGSVSDVVISASEHVVRGQAMDQYAIPATPARQLQAWPDRRCDTGYAGHICHCPRDRNRHQQRSG